MRKIFAIALFACLVLPASAQIFYLQPFTGPGFPSGWTPNGTRVVMSNQAVSSGYSIPPPASGGYNARFDNCLPTGETVTLTVGGVISSIGKSNIRVGFGRRISTAWNLEMAFEWSSDGSNWNLISSDVRPGLTDTWDFVFFDLASDADNVTNLRFRFSFITSTSMNCTAAPNFRVDDFVVGANFSLPVELSRFEIKRVSDQVQINWATRTETDNAYFAIEHSANGEDYSEIGQVAAFGTTREPQQYNFLHPNPEAGMNYYRLRQVDWNGNTAYGPVRVVNFDQNQRLRVFPSPANDYIQVQWERTILIEAGSWEIYDARGLLFSSGQIFDQAMELEIPLIDAAPGLYWLKVKMNGKVFLETFVKS